MVPLRHFILTSNKTTSLLTVPPASQVRASQHIIGASPALYFSRSHVEFVPILFAYLSVLFTSLTVAGETTAAETFLLCFFLLAD